MEKSQAMTVSSCMKTTISSSPFIGKHMTSFYLKERSSTAIMACLTTQKSFRSPDQSTNRSTASAWNNHKIDFSYHHQPVFRFVLDHKDKMISRIFDSEGDPSNVLSACCEICWFQLSILNKEHLFHLIAISGSIYHFQAGHHSFYSDIHLFGWYDWLMDLMLSTIFIRKMRWLSTIISNVIMEEYCWGLLS